MTGSERPPIAPDPPGARASVTIRRDHADDVRQRQIYARVDDGATHTLRFGEAVTVDLEPGDHALKTNNTLHWKTVNFSVAPGEQAEFVLINKAGALAFSFLALLGVGPLQLVVEKAPSRSAT